MQATGLRYRQMAEFIVVDPTPNIVGRVELTVLEAKKRCTSIVGGRCFAMNFFGKECNLDESGTCRDQARSSTPTILYDSRTDKLIKGS